MSTFTKTTTGGWSPQGCMPAHLQAMLTEEGLTAEDYALAFLQLVRLLKTQRRTGWLDHDITECESIADHMYRMGIISMVADTATRTLDTDRCVKIALVHDIAEALVGDITPFDKHVGKEEKHERELMTIEYLCELIQPYNAAYSRELLELWLDYEEIRTDEARLVKDIDKFEMIQQAYEYEVQYGGTIDLDQFFNARASIKTVEIGRLCDRVLQRREKFWQSVKKQA
ncbi:hypothetical protein BABINDRAFT_163149 [Babjeviella inositovora NRRL Y-12698]|uniref:5'-deoxynucleotidase n=1 Tax=Babjeviella inositovora NRRL Y-12698 TaxID=984486 RepID=A0A1E3QL80_9ASCO|nr:uncharacterized protein BABINDRAFT_163149 [Babjeviella inositovora NRRL Y-12698]ODQ77747.1 hypothetical protein BABINDRAFT_163149 [Babjeviella inositovora NRRL Y-12698]